MKTITEDDINIIESELSIARKQFEKMNFDSLEEKLEWISNFFNQYIPKLEKKFMTDEELKEYIFLPNEIRIKFYIYFPEHGLNMANYSQRLVEENSKVRKYKFVDRFYFQHDFY